MAGPPTVGTQRVIAEVVSQLAANGSVPYRATLAEALADFDIGLYFQSDDKAGVGPYPDDLWIYKRTVGSPGYAAQLAATPAVVRFLEEDVAALRSTLYTDTSSNLVVVAPTNKPMFFLSGSTTLMSLDPTAGLSSASFSTGNMTATGASKLGAGSFAGSPNYVGVASESVVRALGGSLASPDQSEAAAGYFEKHSYRGAFNALAGVAHKSVTASNARATAVFGEAVDHAGGEAGGTTSFVEGGRFESTLVAGQYGSGYGTISRVSSVAGGPTNVTYMIGHEAEISDRTGPNAPTYETFSKDKFRASFLATNGLGTGSFFKADAAFVVNAYSLSPYRTGLLLTDKVDDTGVAAASGSSMRSGFDVHLASLSYATLWGPLNAPIRFGPDGDNCLSHDGTAMHVGSSDVGLISFDSLARLTPSTFASLPSPSAATEGVVAYITDAATPVTTWRQTVTAGGGSNKAFVVSDGSSYRAIG